MRISFDCTIGNEPGRLEHLELVTIAGERSVTVSGPVPLECVGELAAALVELAAIGAGGALSASR